MARRDGFALLLAILAVVVAGALIVATHVAVRLDHGVAAAALARQRAFAASEYGLWASVAGWDAGSMGLAPGVPAVTVVPAGRDSATVTVVRLNQEIYWLMSDATVGGGPTRSRRRTGINVRVVSDSAGTKVNPVKRSWVEIH